MNIAPRKLSRFAACLALLCMAWPLATPAFPPAPNHLFFGVVRDQIGNPIDIDTAEIILESSTGVKVSGPIISQVEINYRLEVPMDSGLTADLYQATALLPAAPFRLRVRIGQSTYLPMEMTGDFSKLGLPGGRTRIDLTLGVDADGNGLPDAWERAVATFLGQRWQPGQIRPDDLYGGTGMTYRNVYLAGTYATDPADGFALHVINTPGEPPKLAFTAVKGRHYTVQAADKLDGEWTTEPFRVLPSAPGAAFLEAYHAIETRRVEIEAPLSGNTPARFYRLIVE